MTAVIAYRARRVGGLLARRVAGMPRVRSIRLLGALIEVSWRGGTVTWRRDQARLICVRRPRGPWARTLPRRMLVVTDRDDHPVPGPGDVRDGTPSAQPSAAWAVTLDCSRFTRADFAALHRLLIAVDACAERRS